MNLFNFFNRNRTGSVAHERLQLLLAHERAGDGHADLVALLEKEILAVIARHLPIERDKVVVRLDQGEAVSTLEIDIEMPEAGWAPPR
ncbi:cell division topological specificity factor MinE [Phenylobacterium montanum]|uniref:Cell division topological specificity factor n=1 Tax=Phenylobacterium montanum TaxID=2823693 RepID=A0A975FZT0_9CAUL|nr:cell division topological specificity factor MinE [Caulobacter sp. S6]QUD88475.1 cell division topological specificity factor MinE [Caulobacter sp. S6]